MHARTHAHTHTHTYIHTHAGLWTPPRAHLGDAPTCALGPLCPGLPRLVYAQSPGQVASAMRVFFKPVLKILAKVQEHPCADARQRT
eukprot:1160462-Pelagomonas_calceolata.AAC.6